MKTLRRERLLNLLSTNLDKRVLLLCAGAGYGKTTLLSQFLSDTKIDYVYYHLEKSDAEPAVFLSYLIAGIRKFKPEFGKKTEGLSQYFNYPQTYTEIIVGTFINEFVENIKKDLFIILEDYHALDEAENIDRILTFMLEHLPQYLHFIVTSRTATSISLSQLRARGELLELDGQYFRFTKDEIKDLFETVYANSLKETEIRWIYEHSEGWPAGLRLMLQSATYLDGIKSSDYVGEILDSYYRSQSKFFDYFAQEIFNQESQEIQQFLVDCAVLEWLTPDLCDAITGRKDSGNILSNLTARNAFVLRIPDMGYRFHNLFRDFLRSKFTGMNRKKRIYYRAGNFCFQNSNLEEAVRLYLQAEEYDRAASNIEKIAWNLIEQGKSAVLCSYIERVPISTRNQHVDLLMHYAQSLVHVGRSDEAKNSYLIILSILKRNTKNRTIYADVLYELGGHSLNEGEFSEAKNWFNKALMICPKSSNLTRGSILNSLGLVYTQMGGRNVLEATKYFEEALQTARQIRDKKLESGILNNWATHELKSGNLNEAYSKLLKMVNLLREHFSPHCGVGFLNTTRLSLYLGYKEEVKSMLDAGMKICNVYNDLWSIAALWKGYALFCQELGDIGMAKHYIVKSLEIYEKLGIPRLIVTTLNEMCQINIVAGDLNDAQKNLFAIWWFKKKRDDAEAIPILLTEAKLRIAQGRFNEAEDLLLGTVELSKKFKQIFNSFLSHIELSKTFHYQEKTEKALIALSEAITISQSKGYDYLLSKELQKEKWMLQTLRAHEIEKGYLVSIIKKSRLGIHWGDAFLFGTPKFFVDDYEIEDNVLKTVKAKKLLFYLLLNKDEKVSHDKLVDGLWQNVSEKSGRDSLRKATQHIRQAIKANFADGYDLIVSSKGQYQITPDILISLDTKEFENLVKVTKGLKMHDEKLKSYLEKAISIYKDGFAIGWYDRWVEEMRNYYAGLYEDCLGMMADYYYGNSKFKESIVWFKKLISINFYDEEYHRKLMKVYAKLGKYKELVQDFDKLKDVLEKELSTQPHQETINLYKSLIK